MTFFFITEGIMIRFLFSTEHRVMVEDGIEEVHGEKIGEGVYLEELNWVDMVATWLELVM